MPFVRTRSRWNTPISFHNLLYWLKAQNWTISLHLALNPPPNWGSLLWLALARLHQDTTGGYLERHHASILPTGSHWICRVLRLCQDIFWRQTVGLALELLEFRWIAVSLTEVRINSSVEWAQRVPCIPQGRLGIYHPCQRRQLQVCPWHCIMKLTGHSCKGY